MDKHTFLTGAIVLALALIFGWRFLTSEDTWLCRDGQWVRHGNPSAPMPSTPCGSSPTTPAATATPSSDLLEYRASRAGFTLLYPKDLELETNSDGSISLIKWGPTQRADTEFYDGISINITPVTLTNDQDILSLINSDISQKEDQLGDDFRVVTPPTVYEWTLPGALYYVWEGPFGNSTYIYLPLSQKKYLLVVPHTPDPGNLGFKAVSDDIIQSLKPI